MPGLELSCWPRLTPLFLPYQATHTLLQFHLLFLFSGEISCVARTYLEPVMWDHVTLVPRFEHFQPISMILELTSD